MSKHKLLMSGITITMVLLTSTSPMQAAVSVFYSPHYGVSLNYSDNRYRQNYRRSYGNNRYRQYIPRSYYRSSRNYNSGHDSNNRRSYNNGYRSDYNNRSYGRRCD